MGFGWWTQWRVGRMFDRVGPDCRFRGGSVEVKGHVELGTGCVLGNNLLFRTHKDGIIVLGDEVEVDDYAMMLGNSRIEVGPQAYIGAYCVLRDTNHLFQGTDVHWRLTPHLTRPIIVGAKCYVGARTYIMPGVTIGEGAVVGPASVVTRDIPPGEFWAGNPARFIADRQDPSRRARLRRDLELGSVFGLEWSGSDDDGPGT
jgi:acetyltransferase-like isoleucine patch superfamily enzyme